MKVLQRPSRPRDVGIRVPKPSRSLSATSQTRDSISPEHSPNSLGIQLYKTELCRSFAESGYCRYGLKCRFAHGQPDLRPVMRHKRYKTEKCKNFARNGQCPYGLRCRFIHDTKEQDNLPLSSALCTPILNPTLSPAEAWARAPSDTCAVDFTLDTSTSVSDDDDADIEQYLHENSLVLSDLLEAPGLDESSELLAPLHGQSYNPSPHTLPFSSPIFSPSFSPSVAGQAHANAFAEFSLELAHNLGRTSTFKCQFSNVGFVEKPTIFGLITQPPTLGSVPGDLDKDLSALSLFPRFSR